jgi:FKBP-type peptidyl-prolyl cis-trans isomerase FkpA
MFKQSLYFLSLITFIMGTISCNKGRQKTDFGLEYEHHVKNDGRKPKEGDILTMNFAMYGKSKGKDTLLQSTYKNPTPVEMPYANLAQADALTKSLGIASAGDSLTIYVNADTLMKGNRPEFIDAGSEMRLVVKMIKILSNDEYVKEMEKKMEAQKAIDEDIVKKYVTDNKLEAKRTESGLYYVVTAEGTGASPKQGEQVSVHYTGTLLNGEKFDSSVDRGEPLNFAHNAGQMIKGFDEGVALLKKGGKASLILPSHLAYGAQGAGGRIPPFAVLRFDIELVDIKATAPANQ